MENSLDSIKEIVRKVKRSFSSSSDQVIIKNISGTVLVKGASLVISFLSTPLYLTYFQEEAILGIWFTLLSIVNWILTFDLGIGNGLRNNLVAALAKKEENTIKKLISSAYFVLGFLSVIAFLIGSIIIKYTDWNTVFSVGNTTITPNTLNTAVLIVFVGIILQFWLKLILSILNALQKNALANLCGLLSNVVLLFFLLSSDASTASSSILTLSVVHCLAVNVPLIFFTFYVFRKYLPKSIPSIHFIDKKATINVVSLGSLFFVIQIGLLLINSTNQTLITFLYTPEAVVEYQLYFKYFSLYLMLFTLITQPLWSGVTKAYNNNKIDWIIKVYKVLIILAVLASLIMLLSLKFLQPIYDIWLGKGQFIINAPTAAIFIVIMSVELINAASTCIANGIGKLKCQFFCVGLAAIIKIPLTIYLSSLIGRWESIIVAYFICLLPLLVFQPIVLIKTLKEELYST